MASSTVTVTAGSIGATGASAGGLARRGVGGGDGDGEGKRLEVPFAVGVVNADEDGVARAVVCVLIVIFLILYCVVFTAMCVRVSLKVVLG